MSLDPGYPWITSKEQQGLLRDSTLNDIFEIF